MKLGLKAKLRQYFLTTNQNQGFTKTGWLVRILIYSCVSTALGWRYYIPLDGYDCPFLNTVCKTAKSEARQTLGAIARSQQAYRLDNHTFARSIPELTALTYNSESSIVFKAGTKDYSYQVIYPMVPVQSLNEQIDSASLLQKEFIMIAQPKQPERFVPYFMAGTFVVKDRNNQETPMSEICQFKFHTRFPSSMPSLTPSKEDGDFPEYPECPKDSLGY